MDINEAQFILDVHTYWVLVASVVIAVLGVLVALFRKNK